jgi:hypothetical protein
MRIRIRNPADKCTISNSSGQICKDSEEGIQKIRVEKSCEFCNRSTRRRGEEPKSRGALQNMTSDAFVKNLIATFSS